MSHYEIFVILNIQKRRAFGFSFFCISEASALCVFPSGDKLCQVVLGQPVLFQD